MFRRLATLVSCSSPVPGSGNVQTDVGGNFGFCHAGRREDSMEEGSLLKSLGAVWVRLDFSWRRIQPAADVWDFSYYDELIQRTLAAGVKVLAILDYDTAWIHDDPSKLREVLPEHHQAWSNYVTTVAERYGSSVGAFEIWNEPNYAQFWTGSDSDFFALTDLTLDILQETTPDTPVTVGSVLLHPVTGGERFLKRMAESIDLTRADAVSVHPYGMSARANLRRVFSAREALNRRGFRGEMWITEAGFPTGGKYPHTVSLETQAEVTVKSLVWALAGGIELFTWYELYDRRERGETEGHAEKHFGVAYPDRTLKPAGAALSVLAPVTASGRYLPDLLDSAIPGFLEAYPFTVDNGSTILVLWSKGRKRKISVVGLGAEFEVHDVRTEKRAKGLSGESLRISSTPLILTGPTTSERITLTLSR